MQQYGLIGYPLEHSFSRQHFTEKFSKLNLPDHEYNLYPLPDISQIVSLFSSPDLRGLNVTIPYKQAVMNYLDEIDDHARLIGAINTVKFLPDGRKKGYNTDYHGFLDSLTHWCPVSSIETAFVLGTGGASKAVCAALTHLNVPYYLVSRSPKEGVITYQEMENRWKPDVLVVNTTPLGMHPGVSSKPAIPYHLLNDQCYCYDLVYNPGTTAFMAAAEAQGAYSKNGLEMLQLQAEKAWEIWNS